MPDVHPLSYIEDSRSQQMADTLQARFEDMARQTPNRRVNEVEAGQLPGDLRRQAAELAEVRDSLSRPKEIYPFTGSGPRTGGLAALLSGSDVGSGLPPMLDRLDLGDLDIGNLGTSDMRGQSGTGPPPMSMPDVQQGRGDFFSEEISGAAGDWSITDQEILQDPQTGQYQVEITFRLPDGSQVTETGSSESWSMARGIARARAMGKVSRYHAGGGRAYGGIIGLAGGGYIPMYAQGGHIPGYGFGGFLRGLGKVVSKAAPIAMNFIPGLSNLSGVAKAGIGALAQGVGDLSDDKGLNLQSMLGGAGRSYALSSGLDRVRNLDSMKGLVDSSGEELGLFGKLGKVLTDQNIGKEAMGAFADIPMGEAIALGVAEKAGERGRQQQAAEEGGYTPGQANPMDISGRTMPGRVMPASAAGVPNTGGPVQYADDMTYGNQPNPTGSAYGGLISGYREGGRFNEGGGGEGGGGALREEMRSGETMSGGPGRIYSPRPSPVRNPVAPRPGMFSRRGSGRTPR